MPASSFGKDSTYPDIKFTAFTVDACFLLQVELVSNPALVYFSYFNKLYTDFYTNMELCSLFIPAKS